MASISSSSNTFTTLDNFVIIETQNSDSEEIVLTNKNKNGQPKGLIWSYINKLQSTGKEYWKTQCPHCKKV